MIQRLNNLEQFEKQQAAQKRLDFATSVRERFARSAKKQPGDDKLLAYSPVELLYYFGNEQGTFFQGCSRSKSQRANRGGLESEKISQK
jgi:hypothetical protein